LYTTHGFKNGHKVPLVYALLPSKSEVIYCRMIKLLLDCIKENGLTLNPTRIVPDYEIVAHNAYKSLFPDATISCCRFHLVRAGTEESKN